ncbi:receptor-type tyrosine-protein phosphatase s, partial [Plakobranchus ocellatus]
MNNPLSSMTYNPNIEIIQLPGIKHCLVLFIRQECRARPQTLTGTFASEPHRPCQWGNPRDIITLRLVLCHAASGNPLESSGNYAFVCKPLNNEINSEVMETFFKSTIVFEYFTAQQCPREGWFGDKCQFQCHCAVNTGCDPSNGICSNGCDPRWFGPGCQYDVSEFTVTGGSGSDLSWLIDNDDTTCNNGNVQSITVRLSTPHPFTWVRIVVRDTVYFNEIQLSYQTVGSQASTLCVNPRSARVDDVTLDIFCPSSDVVSHVTLSSPNELGLCSFYISGECCRHRLINFTLQAFPSSGTSPIYSYTDPGGPAQLLYTVVPSPPSALSVMSVRIDVRRNTDRENVLTLCEVYVFGEVVCPQDKFGRQCERDCNCADQTEACFVSTGGCPSGCAAGYIGEDCYTQCSSGTYGKDCDRNCSDHCAGDDKLCNHVNGTCDQGCDTGYQMPLCEDKCPVTKYGQDCAQSCNATCLNRECHHVTGECNNCSTGYTGVFCEKVAEQNIGGGDSGDGALIPAIVGAVVAVVVITAVIVGILCWRRRSGAKHESRDGSMIESTVETGNTYSNPALDTGKPERPSRQSKPRYVNFAVAQEVNDTEESEEDERSETSENPYTNILTDDTSVPVEELKAYLHQHSTDSHFKDEFMAIPMDLGQDQNHGAAARNSKKNRYKNIIPYDTNRVLLEVDEKRKLADYINASYVKGYNDCETFIASQGPNDAILNDFVRMLWEQNIDRVVMLTHLIELGKIKCTMYWPEDGEKTFGEIKMHLLTTRVFAEYTIRHLRLCKGDELPRDVTQFHFTAWPDKSVPENPWGLVDFQQRVMAEPGPGRLL